ncbi:hypothetical protein GCM10009039_30310 [Halocalculus aciditolerans]|uniref:Uncharacterized protein n=2 Tax=Halocalculus aciditolerans TaxID=1383812 RepID=A0A830FFP6_9EURY|nr:hypothetical protein GCM10009039_30310 [Halocalculus aciditolerans]
MRALSYLLNAGLVAAAVVGDYVTAGRHRGRRERDVDAGCEVITEEEECGERDGVEAVPLGEDFEIAACPEHAPGMVIYQ